MFRKQAGKAALWRGVCKEFFIRPVQMTETAGNFFLTKKILPDKVQPLRKGLFAEVGFLLQQFMHEKCVFL